MKRQHKTLQTLLNSFTTVANTDVYLTYINLLWWCTWDPGGYLLQFHDAKIPLYFEPVYMNYVTVIFLLPHTNFCYVPCCDLLVNINPRGIILSLQDLVLVPSYSCDHYFNTLFTLIQDRDVLKPQCLNESKEDENRSFLMCLWFWRGYLRACLKFKYKIHNSVQVKLIYSYKC
jgi:hypothetical protein